VKEIEKGIQPALDDFTAAGKVLIRSGSFEKSGNEMIENVGYIKSVFLLNKKIFDSERGKKYEI